MKLFILIFLFISSSSFAEAQKTASKCSLELSGEKEFLTENQKNTIYQYTTGGYFIFNNYLRGEKLKDINRRAKSKFSGKELQELINELKQALKKLPPEKGVFYRSIRLDEEAKYDLLEYYQPGETIIKKAFVSMTDNKSGEGDHFGEANIIFKISTKKGKRIEELSSKPYEKEVILPPNQSFKVKSVKGHWVKDPEWDSMNKNSSKTPSYVKAVRKEKKDRIKNKRKEEYEEIQEFFEENSPRDTYNRIRRGEFPVIQITLEHLS